MHGFQNGSRFNNVIEHSNRHQKANCDIPCYGRKKIDAESRKYTILKFAIGTRLPASACAFDISSVYLFQIIFWTSNIFFCILVAIGILLIEKIFCNNCFVICRGNRNFCLTWKLLLLSVWEIIIDIVFFILSNVNSKIFKFIKYPVRTKYSRLSNSS